MRELYMRSGQGFLLVFSITSPNSLAELTTLHTQLTRIKSDPAVPVVLVGNKSDLEDQRAVSRNRAFALSQSWGNKPYYETSARRRTNVDEVFIDLCRQIIRRDMERGEAGSASRSNGQPRDRDREDGRSGGGDNARRERERDHRPRDRDRDRERERERDRGDERDEDRRGRRKRERKKREQRCTIL